MSMWLAIEIGLPVSPDFSGQELVKTRIDSVGELSQQAHALGDRQLSPRSFERGARRADRGIHLSAAGRANLSDRFAGRRKPVGEAVLIAADEHAVDEIAILRHDTDPSCSERSSSPAVR